MRDAYNLHAEALLDCYRGEKDAVLIVEQDGERDDVPAAFWLRTTFDELESAALDLCRGRILDVGAGAGVHALELQRRGLDVTAIDVAPKCVTIMRERGVRKTVTVDVFELNVGRFDTILSICNGLDKVGQLDHLVRFLDRMRALLAPGGQLLVDSFDLRVGAGAEQTAELARKQRSGRYFGELTLRFEYKGKRGAPFSVLHVDYETLSQVAAPSGWRCELLQRKGGHYLARLWPRAPWSPA